MKQHLILSFAIIARHDLFFNVWQRLGLRLANDQKYAILTPEFTPESIATALRRRADLLAANPHMLILAALVFSNGYALFSDPNSLPTPDHLHDWYPFWDKSLGKPAGPHANLNRPNLNGAYTRQWSYWQDVFFLEDGRQCPF
jgi:hypothetical protein